MVIPIIGGGNGGIRIQGDRDIHHKDSEHGLDLEGAKNRAVVDSDGEEEIGEEEVITLETTTGRELGRGYKVAT